MNEIFMNDKMNACVLYKNINSRGDVTSLYKMPNDLGVTTCDCTQKVSRNVLPIHIHTHVVVPRPKT